MSLNSHFSIVARNAGVAALAALLNNGYLRLYDNTGGGQPANADGSIGSAVLLAELRFANPTAFGAASGGSASANAIASTTAVATGATTFFVVLESDGTTVVAMGSCGIGSSYDLNWNNNNLQIGAQVSITSFSISIPA